MSKNLILFFALLGLASAATFSFPLKQSTSLKEKMIRKGRYHDYVAQKRFAQSQNSNTGKQILFDTSDRYYTVDITLGTPAQNFTVAIDTTSPNLWVIDVDCYAPFCYVTPSNSTFTRMKYNNTASTSYVDSDSRYWLPYENDQIFAMLGKERLGMTGFTQSKQDFLRATVVPEIFVFEPIDGVLGLGWPSQALNGTTSVMQNLLPQLDQPVFSIWMQKINTAKNEHSGAIMYGGIDGVACDKKVNYVQLADAGTWEFMMDGFSMGSFSRQQKEKAVSATESGWTGVPNQVLAGIIKITNAKYDWTTDAYLVSCSITQPDITFIIGGIPYVIKSEDYVIDLGLKYDQCALAFYGKALYAGQPVWSLGDMFIRTYCHVYDFGNARIGFSKFVKRD